METFEKEKSGFAQELQQRHTKPTMNPGMGVATHVGHSTSMWQGNRVIASTGEQTFQVRRPGNEFPLGKPTSSGFVSSNFERDGLI